MVWDEKSHSSYQCSSFQQVFCEGEDQTVCMLELYCHENTLTLSSSCMIFLIFKCSLLTNKHSTGLQTYSLNGDKNVTEAKTFDCLNRCSNGFSSPCTELNCSDFKKYHLSIFATSNRKMFSLSPKMCLPISFFLLRMKTGSNSFNLALKSCRRW